MSALPREKASIRISAIAVGYAVFALLVVTPGASAQGGTAPVSPKPASSAADAKPCISASAKQHQMSNSDESPFFTPTGDPDRDFAHMMSAHHQEGVDMAKRQIAIGKSSKLKTMARRIIRDQQREILELDNWSARHNVRVSRGDPP